jgi:hypothetical protein
MLDFTEVDMCVAAILLCCDKTYHPKNTAAVSEKQL